MKYLQILCALFACFFFFFSSKQADVNVTTTTITITAEAVATPVRCKRELISTRNVVIPRAGRQRERDLEEPLGGGGVSLVPLCSRSGAIIYTVKRTTGRGCMHQKGLTNCPQTMSPSLMAEETEQYTNDGDTSDSTKGCNNNNFLSTNKSVPLGMYFSSFTTRVSTVYRVFHMQDIIDCNTLTSCGFPNVAVVKRPITRHTIKI